ncbi:selenium-dependent molybdenum cofactor biosynthesis protein YqeB [Desulforamulus aeronauticus]|uniref:Xanthine dehydrogenase accessory factor n=1 Tax=Desulforamulus aeronauticus DSM 10349 TaxID=1121421 RepID=A0A1M6PEN0_9FIRM|nr:selenium-dependent molybdenum cofactor biosynthesis protein YqeB [Desulforamulus aeronauticus]SHK06377.1 xanthine dehydrogenase accessory factor [Desulforamulus aeronauticus DSM 10349]
MELLVWVKGAGDLATGVAHRLHGSGFKVIMTEIPRPTMVRRTVSFAEAVYEGRWQVEGSTAVLVKGINEIANVFKQQMIPVLVDPAGQQVTVLRPDVLVDAIIAKRNTGTHRNLATIAIGLGPGFTAGVDVHAVIETNRGHYLGRVILNGTAQLDTGSPSPVEGYTRERLLRSPAEGVFVPCVTINSVVQSGQTIGFVGGEPVNAGINGVLRGLLRGGLWVHKGLKLGDIDPREDCLEHCFTISDKARAIGGGVLEAILYLQRHSS